jgi:hypothetical protein
MLLLWWGDNWRCRRDYLDVHVDLITLGNIAEIAPVFQVRDLGLWIEFVSLISHPLWHCDFVHDLPRESEEVRKERRKERKKKKKKRKKKKKETHINDGDFVLARKSIGLECAGKSVELQARCNLCLLKLFQLAIKRMEEEEEDEKVTKKKKNEEEKRRRKNKGGRSQTWSTMKSTESAIAGSRIPDGKLASTAFFRRNSGTNEVLVSFHDPQQKMQERKKKEERKKEEYHQKEVHILKKFMRILTIQSRLHFSENWWYPQMSCTIWGTRPFFLCIERTIEPRILPEQHQRDEPVSSMKVFRSNRRKRKKKKKKRNANLVKTQEINEFRESLTPWIVSPVVRVLNLHKENKKEERRKRKKNK